MHTAGQVALGMMQVAGSAHWQPSQIPQHHRWTEPVLPLPEGIYLDSKDYPERALACALQPTNVTAEEAEDYQPFVEQAGTQADFPNATGTNPFALTGTVVRYLAIGGMALTSLSR